MYSPSGTWSITTDRNQFQPSQPSIAALLRDEAKYNTFMAGKYHLGGTIPLKGSKQLNYTHLLTGMDHDWARPLIGGAQDIGFTESFITTGGIQSRPYAWLHNGLLEFNQSDAFYWKNGSYATPIGISEIPEGRNGEGDPYWDSSAYNQILVNKTAEFIDLHLDKRPEDPMFMYLALGSVHSPHTPPYKYMNGPPIAGEHPTKHMDMLKEMDYVVGSLVSIIEEKGLGEL